MKIDARIAVLATVAGVVGGGYLALCGGARQLLHPNDAWHAARTMASVALHRNDRACEEQLEVLGKAMKSRVRSDGLAAGGQIHSYRLPAMTTQIAASSAGKHYVTVARPDGLTVRDIEAMEEAGWSHGGSFDGMDVFERGGFALNVSTSRAEKACLTSIYVTVAKGTD